ncbi:MAG: glycosyltransferase family 39 protein [Chloroflexi bacterium]|nr:glycosyltransferase family 39 protein [Chloroflexota bacterium]
MSTTQQLANREQTSSFASIHRLEALIMAALILLGFGLRAWQLENAGLDHFDEGVYVFSALGLTDSTQPHQLYPQQERFSPPVYLGLLSLSYLLNGGPADTAAIFVNILLGTISIGLIWWIGRSWFNSTVGIVAATLLTFSEYHIELSRTALTDITFSLFFLIALAVIVAALRRQSFGWAMLAGLAVGIAWNSKYHGMFALIATGGALLPYSWLQYRQGKPIRRNFLLFGVMGVVAVACYLPWALYIQSQPGGYAGLAAYQRTLLSLAWPANFWRYIQFQAYYIGPLSRFSVPLAFFLAAIVSHRKIQLNSRFWALSGLLALVALGLGSVGTAVILTLIAIPILLRQRDLFASWLLLAWLGLWLVMTPLYQPYARLILPFVMAAYLAAGLVLAAAVNYLSDPQEESNWRPIGALAGVTTVTLLIAFLLPSQIEPWRPERNQAETAAAVQEIVPPGSRIIVLGEPTLAYYLHLAGYRAFERTEDMAVIESLETPVYLMTGTYADRAPSLRQGLKRLEDRLTLLGAFPMEPGDVRLLDDTPPQKATAYRTAPDDTYTLTLYYLSPQTEE